MSPDPVQTAYGVVLAALRGDESGARALLDDHDATEVREIAHAALLSMSDAMRNHLDPQVLNDITRAVQRFAYTEQEQQS